MLGYSENGKQIYYTQYYSTQRTKSEAECATTEEQLLTKIVRQQMGRAQAAGSTALICFNSAPPRTYPADPEF